MVVSVVAHLIPRIAVIGCGNPARSDDGVGLEVVRQLHASEAFRAHPVVTLLDAGPDGLAVLFAARGASTLIIIDACHTGAEPGAIFEVPGDTLAAAPRNGFNLHELRWDHALHAGRAMYGLAFPADVTVFLIEAQTLGLGIGLSTAAQAASIAVALRVSNLVLARLSHVPTIQIARGRIHVERALFERFFAGTSQVALLRDGADLAVLPVHQAAAGGYLVKLRNRAGDRVIDAADFLRGEGLDDHVERSVPVTWSEPRSALIALRVFT